MNKFTYCTVGNNSSLESFSFGVPNTLKIYPQVSLNVDIEAVNITIDSHIIFSLQYTVPL